MRPVFPITRGVHYRSGSGTTESRKTRSEEDGRERKVADGRAHRAQ